MTFQEVTFEIDPQNNLMGTLSVFLSDNDYIFEWVPHHKGDLEESDMIGESLRVIFRLCELSAIIKNDSSVSPSVLFLTNDGEKLPLFQFLRAEAQVLQLLELFEQNGAISPSPTPNQYMVTVPFTEPATSLPVKCFLQPHDAVLLAQHRQIVKSLLSKTITFDDNPVDLDEARSYFSDDGLCTDILELKRHAFERGLTDDARCFLWPYFLGVANPSQTFAANLLTREQRFHEYQVMKRQWESFLEDQKNGVRGVSELLRVVMNDVKRNDRLLPQFMDDDSPYLAVLHDVLVTFGVYDKDCGYVQGMGDIISPILTRHVTSWTDPTTAVLWNGSSCDRAHVESDMFWMLTAILSVSQLDRLMTDMARQQQFLLERTCAMAMRVHPPLRKWLSQTENTNLLFIYRPYLLLYKRDFPAETVVRLWDSFFAAERQSSFHRYFTAAILIALYPKFLLYTNGSLGEVVQLTDDEIQRLDALMCLSMAHGLECMSMKDLTHLEWELQDLPIDSGFTDYIPTMLFVKSA